MLVFLTSEVVQRLQAGDANRYVDYTVTPGSPERVGGDYGHIYARLLLDEFSNARGGCIGVDGEERYHVLARHVGGIYPSVGADEAVARLGYQYALVHLYHPLALPQHDLDLAWVLPPFL